MLLTPAPSRNHRRNPPPAVLAGVLFARLRRPRSVRELAAAGLDGAALAEALDALAADGVGVQTDGDLVWLAPGKDPCCA
jgi:hypothetical protein